MLTFRTFGGVSLSRDGEVLGGAATQRRRLALLALLASAGERGISRDKIVALLWPESEEEKARHTLSQWLFLLRKDLREPDLVVGSAELRLNSASVSCDVVEFERALARGDREAAVAHYQGPFLDGFFLSDAAAFGRWAEDERARIERLAYRAAEELARAAADAGATALAVRHWEWLATHDRLSSRAAIGYMRALAAAGEAARAIQHARVHELLVREELETDPDPAVAALARELAASPRSGPTAPAAPSPARAAPAPRDPQSGESGRPSSRRSSPVRLGDGFDSDPRVIAAGWTDVEPAVPADGAPEIGGTSVAKGPRVTLRTVGARRRRRRQRLVGFAVGGLLIMLVLVGAAAMPAAGRALLVTLLTRESVPLVPNRVVVAPFEMRDGDSTSSYLGEMAADWVTEGLAELPNVEAVDARTVMFTSRILARLPRPLRRDAARALARETGSSFVVSGTIYRVGDSLLVQARLVDVATGRVERSIEPTSAAAADPSGLLVRLRPRVIAALATVIEPDARGLALGSTTPPSYDAYREMVLGWTKVMTQGGPEAERHFLRAAALDTTFVSPLLSAAYLNAYVDDRWAADSFLQRVAPHAATLSPADRALLAHVRAMVHGDPAEQLGTVLEWVDRSPGSFEVPVAAAMTATFHMRPHLALELLARADPDRGLNLVSDLHCSTRAVAYHELGDFARQLAVARDCLRRFPAGSEIWKHRIVALAAAGRVDELTRALDEAPRRLRGGLTPFRLRRWAAVELEAHGHHAASRELARRSLADLPRLAEDTTTQYALLALGHMRLLADDWRAATETAARVAARDTVRFAGLALVGVLAARRGDRATAEWAEAQAGSARDPFMQGEALLTRAQIRAELGDRAEAVRLLEEARATGQVKAMNLHAMVGLMSLRGYPPFQALVRPDGP